MATYYLTSAGSNIAPYDTEATGANSLAYIKALPTFYETDTIIVCTDIDETVAPAILCNIQAKDGLSFRPKITYSSSGPFIFGFDVLTDVIIKDVELISTTGAALIVIFSLSGGSVSCSNVIFRNTSASGFGPCCFGIVNLYNCLVEQYHATQPCISLSNTEYVINCTLISHGVDADHGFPAVILYTPLTEFKNNIIYESVVFTYTTYVIDSVSTSAFDYNIYWNGAVTTKPLFSSGVLGSHNLNVDPLFSTFPSADQYLLTSPSLAYGYCPGKINCGWNYELIPSTFYIGNSGDETYPYNTPERACHSFSRLLSKFDTKVDLSKIDANTAKYIYIVDDGEYIDESTSDTITLSDLKYLSIINSSSTKIIKIKVNNFQPLFNFKNLQFANIGVSFYLMRDSNQGNIPFITMDSCRYVQTYFNMVNSVESTNTGYTISNTDYINIHYSEFKNIGYPIYATTVTNISVSYCIFYSFITGVELTGSPITVFDNVFYGRGRNIGTNTTSIKWTETADQGIKAIDWNCSYNVNTNAICTYVGASKMGTNNVVADPLFVNAPAFLATTTSSPCRTNKYYYYNEGTYTFDCGTSATATLKPNEYTAPVKINVTTDCVDYASYYYMFVWEDALGYHCEHKPLGVAPVINVTSGTYVVGAYLGYLNVVTMTNYDTVTVTVSPTSAYTDADDNWKLIEGRNSKTLWDARDNVIVTETIVDDNTASTTSDTNFKFALRNNAIFSTNGSSVIPNSSYRKY